MKANKMTPSCEITFKIGDVLSNKWVILEFIDKGGMGEVYRAHQISLNRDVAVKVVSRQWIESLDEDDEEAETMIQRFRREVQAMAQMNHPNVLQVFDHDSITVNKCDQDTTIEYIAMEYIPGGSLRATMSEEGFYPDESAVRSWIIQYFIPVLSGVKALHDYGIVHRDLKPENILMDHGTPKIADFGLVRSNRLKPVTQSMDIKGSPHYMSPEHFFDFKRADQRADVYSLGKILFEVIEGKTGSGAMPFKSVKLAESESPFFQQLDQVVQGATAESRDKRTESVQNLKNHLEEIVKAPGLQEQSADAPEAKSASLFSRPKWIWTGVAAAMISVLLMSAWHFMGEPGLNSIKGIAATANGKRELQTAANRGAVAGIPDKTDTPFLSEHLGKQRLIPGGELVIPPIAAGGNTQKFQVATFYMDEFFVTNQQVVEFLNHNLARINVENGVVKGDGTNWLFLGEVHAGHEPIVYRNEKFHTSDPAYASSPALRVTGYGASAFATYFSRRLPMAIELLYAIVKGAGSSPFNPKNSFMKPGGKHMEGMMMDNWNEREQWSIEKWNGQSYSRWQDGNPGRGATLSEFTSPAVSHNPNNLGIRGLNKGIGEWGLKRLAETPKNQTAVNRYAVIGGTEGAPQKGSALPQVVARLPWEGFEEIGFRTVKNVKQ
ncbi:MAG: hypothetical protein DRH90_22930 [Deltaproteobacteria bacterium]|nr:MAG: hypothetical protein DRH90_22930 [Deltaproteobacteria bacterium]